MVPYLLLPEGRAATSLKTVKTIKCSVNNLVTTVVSFTAHFSLPPVQASSVKIRNPPKLHSILSPLPLASNQKTTIHSGESAVFTFTRIVAIDTTRIFFPEIDWARGDGLTSLPPFPQVSTPYPLAQLASYSKKGSHKKYFGERMRQWQHSTLCVA